MAQGFQNIVSREIFEGLFPNPNQLYSYDGLVAATESFPQFCNENSSNDREAAAFLANIAHETGDLVFVEEQNPQSDYCDPSVIMYPCAPGNRYFGRGPIQLSWNYNYGPFGSYIGEDLLQNPGLVASDSRIAFASSIWFWMTQPQASDSPHARIRSNGFAGTIDAINGGLECDQGSTTPQAQARIDRYLDICGRLGVDPGENLAC